MGKPIITTYAVGCREAVDHGKTGLLVPAKDVAALVQAMKWMLEHREQWLKMGMAGRQKVEKQFYEKVVIDRIMREYKN